MKTFNWLFVVFATATISVQAQDAKLHLKDFTPKFTIDTFAVKGVPSFVKRRVINLQQAKGIKSAYWDEVSFRVTVQYNNSQVKLTTIKAFFLY